MVQRPLRGRLQHARRRDVGRGVLAGQEPAVAERAAVQRQRPPGKRLLELVGELGGLSLGDDGPEVQLGQRVVGRRDGQRVAEAQVGEHRQVGREERREQPALHDEARVGGAALLGVLEAFADVLGEQRPLAEVPDAPGVEPFLLQEVPAAPIRERGRAPRGRWTAAADERQRAEAGLLTSTSPSFDPGPESRVIGRPARAMNACASVRQWKPPWVGVFATTALPASACTSSACTCTLTG